MIDNNALEYSEFESEWRTTNDPPELRTSDWHESGKLKFNWLTVAGSITNLYLT